MLSTERPAFEEHIKALLAGYDRKPTPERMDAYWRGLNRMALPAVDRVVTYALSERGPDDLPTPKRLWFINHELRVRPESDGVKGQERDNFKSFGNRVMLAFLLAHGSVSNACLVRLIQRKNLITKQFRESVEPGAEVSAEVSGEWRDLMLDIYREMLEERTAEELERDREMFNHARRLPDFSHHELQQIQEVS